LGFLYGLARLGDWCGGKRRWFGRGRSLSCLDRRRRLRNSRGSVLDGRCGNDRLHGGSGCHWRLDCGGRLCRQELLGSPWLFFA